MNYDSDPLFIFRVIATLAFFAVLFGGGYLMLKLSKTWGVDPGMPSENSSSRAYNKLQICLIWAHGLLLTGMLALLLH